MRDVAEMAGVSVQTVSNVVNGRTKAMSEATRERVLEAVGILDFHPNYIGRALRARRSKTLGFLVLDPEYRFLTDPMTDLIISGIGDVVRDRGYSLLIHAGRPDTEKPELLDSVFQRQVDGVILCLSGPPELRHSYIDEARRQQTADVMLIELDPRGTLPSVTSDNQHAAKLLVDHLVSRGHRRIAFIASKVPWPMAEARYAGYCRSLEQHGIERDPRLEIFDGAWTPANGGEVTQRLLALPHPPTAIMAGNDLLALGAIHELGKLGLDVPEDIAVTGFNDFDFAAYMRPSLTTVRVPGYEMGTLAAADLIDALEGVRTGPPQQHVLPVELQVRESA